MLKLNVIGAGRCGRTISYLLAEAHLVQIVGICNRRYETAQEAADFIGQGEVFAIPSDLPTADIWLIACSDDQIKSMVEQIFKVPDVQLPKIVFHCSGVLSSDILQAFQAKGCAIASAHPMHSFANPLESIRSFSGSYCALEGDEEAIRQLTFLFEQLGAKTFVIGNQLKTLYHLAGVLSSNYLVTLAHLANQCLTDAGIEKDIGKNMIVALMHSTLKNIHSNIDYSSALTGPIQRGDYLTIEKHIQAISQSSLVDVYARLGLETLKLATIDPHLKDKLQTILTIPPRD